MGPSAEWRGGPRGGTSLRSRLPWCGSCADSVARAWFLGDQAHRPRHRRACLAAERVIVLPEQGGAANQGFVVLGGHAEPPREARGDVLVKDPVVVLPDRGRPRGNIATFGCASSLRRPWAIVAPQACASGSDANRAPCLLRRQGQAFEYRWLHRKSEAPFRFRSGPLASNTLGPARPDGYLAMSPLQL
jgi:hypothetical protein